MGSSVWGVDSMLYGSFCGLSETSSSDGFSPSFGSDLGSTGTETESEDGGKGKESDNDEAEEDFIVELTRQMADYMFQDEDEDEDVEDGNECRTPHEFSPKLMQPCGCEYQGKWCNCNASSVCYYNNKELLESDSANGTSFMLNNSTRPIEVYELSNQPCVAKQGRRVKAESTQQRSRRGRKRRGGGGGKVSVMKNGSGMQAIFIGSGSGQRNDPNSGGGGTGVFLPRGTNQHPTETKKKSGCSTVLIPVRVLQALQLHFNHIDAISQPNRSTLSPPNHHLAKKDCKTKELISSVRERRATEMRPQPTNQKSTCDDETVQLPQEWIY